jgi:hypothetical protein
VAVAGRELNYLSARGLHLGNMVLDLADALVLDQGADLDPVVKGIADGEL